MTPNVDYDEYGEVINGDKTYQAIAMHLSHAGSAIIGWTDGEYTHLDILFTLAPAQAGSLQRGLRGPNELFVSVIGFGCFGFSVGPDPVDRHPNYIGEKLGLGYNSTTEKLTELINGIIGIYAPVD